MPGKPIPRDTERFKLLFTSRRPILPPGYSAPLSLKTTRELRSLCLAGLLVLSGCTASAALIGLQVGGALIGIADKVADIDVSLTQDRPDKVPLAKVLTPTLSPVPPGVLP